MRENSGTYYKSGNGGGIMAESSMLVLRNSAINGNIAQYAGGGIALALVVVWLSVRSYFAGPSGETATPSSPRGPGTPPAGRSRHESAPHSRTRSSLP